MMAGKQSTASACATEPASHRRHGRALDAAEGINMILTQVHPSGHYRVPPISAVAVIVILILVWPSIGKAAGALTDVLTLVAALATSGYIGRWARAGANPALTVR